MDEGKAEEAAAWDESGSEDEDQEEDIKGSVKDAYLLKACRVNKFVEAIFWLKKEPHLLMKLIIRFPFYGLLVTEMNSS